MDAHPPTSSASFTFLLGFLLLQESDVTDERALLGGAADVGEGAVRADELHEDLVLLLLRARLPGLDVCDEDLAILVMEKFHLMPLKFTKVYVLQARPLN